MARPREGYHDLFAQIPDRLWDALAKEAAANERSAAGQLTWILKERYPDDVDAEPEPQPPEKKQRKRKGKV